MSLLLQHQSRVFSSEGFDLGAGAGEVGVGVWNTYI